MNTDVVFPGGSGISIDHTQPEIKIPSFKDFFKDSDKFLGKKTSNFLHEQSTVSNMVLQNYKQGNLEASVRNVIYEGEDSLINDKCFLVKK